MKVLPFLLFILGSHFLVFLISKITLTFISVGMMFPVILLIVYILSKLPRWLSLIVLAFILFSNIIKIGGPSIFKVQLGMNLGDELRVVRRTYEISQGREFSINTLTNPYLYPTLWVYLYKLNGNKMPYYRGITTYDFAGRNDLIFSDAPRPIEFLIVEPEVSLPVREPNENRLLTKIEKIGEFTLYSFVPLAKDNR